MNESREIDRGTVEAILIDRVRQMIEREVPGFETSDSGRTVISDLANSKGFQSLVTRQVAELEARMKGQVH